MQLPSGSAAPRSRVRFGGYLVRRLRRAGKNALATDVQGVTATVKATARALEDQEEAIQEALADRDGADDDLDLATQTARNALAGRSVDAVTKAPYLDIFPQGIGYYIAATLDTQVARYTELRTRLEGSLPATDAVRSTAVAAVMAGLTDFATSTTALTAAQNAKALTETQLERATDAWERLVEKVYGALIADEGRAAAERYFPRKRAAKNDPE